jgi:DNA mismatch repair protein MutS
VVRIVTPGTLTEESLLAPGATLPGCHRPGRREFGCAWVDITTGAFFTEAVARATSHHFWQARSRRGPSGRPLAEDPDLVPALAAWRQALTPLEQPAFDSIAAGARLERQFGVATLEGFGRFGRAEIAAAGAILDYLAQTQKGLLPRLDRPERVEPETCLRIDPATRRNLELLSSLDGRRQGSLLATIDRTLTGAGARLLAERLAAPLAALAPIQARLAEVTGFVADAGAWDGCRERLKGVRTSPAPSPPRPRTGGPRDLGPGERPRRRSRDSGRASRARGGAGWPRSPHRRYGRARRQARCAAGALDAISGPRRRLHP